MLFKCHCTGLAAEVLNGIGVVVIPFWIRVCYGSDSKQNERNNDGTVDNYVWLECTSLRSLKLVTQSIVFLVTGI